MIDIGERFGGVSIGRVAIPAENEGFLGRGEGTVKTFRLGAELRGGAGQVCGGDKIDFRFASAKG